MNFDQGLAYETGAKDSRKTKKHAQKDGKENHAKICTSRQTSSMFALWVSYRQFREIRARTAGYPQLTLPDLWPSFLFRTTRHSLTQTSQRDHSRVDHSINNQIAPNFDQPFLPLVGSGPLPRFRPYGPRTDILFS